MPEPIVVRPAEPGETNYHTTDVFSLGHMMWGTLMGYGGATFLNTLIVSVGWEVIEPTLKRMYPKAFPSHTIDTFANKAGDTTFWMMGWYLGYALRDDVRGDDE